MKRILRLLTLAAFITTAHAQDSTAIVQDTLTHVEESRWQITGNLGLNISQFGVVNWAQGGETEASVTTQGNVYANYRHGTIDWQIGLETGYGYEKQKHEGLRKADDHLTFISKFNQQATGNLLYSINFNLRTQFSNGYNYGAPDSIGSYPVISRFMAPGNMETGVGLTYRPEPYLEILLSPLADRLVIVLDDHFSRVGEFGVEPGKRLQSNTGMFGNITFNKEVFDHVMVRSRMEVFASYKTLMKMVVTWENVINFTVNDIINTSLSTNVVYDEKVPILRDDGTFGPATQFKEVLALGIAYQF